MGAAPRRLILAALGATVAGAVFSVPYVATHDGPHHFASCVLAERLSDPQSSLHEYLELGAPLSSQGFHTVCRAAVEVLDPFAAYAVTLTLLALVYGLGFAALAGALDVRSPVWPLGFAFAFPWVFYMGFFSFHLSIGLGLVVLALALRWPPLTSSAARLALLSALMLAIAYAHVFGAALVGATLAAIWLVRAPEGQRAATLARTALVGAPALLLFSAVFATFLSPQTYQGIGAIDASTAYDRRPLVDLAETFAGGHPARAWGLLGGVVASAVVGAAQWRRLTGTRRLLLGLGVLGLAAGALAPFHVEGWWYFAPRLSLLWPPLLCLVPRWPERGRLAATAAAVAVAIASLAWSGVEHRRVYAAIAPDLAALDAPVQRTQARLPIFLGTVETSFAHVDPVETLGHLYVIAQGGVDPFVWAQALTLDPLAFRDVPEALFGGVLPGPSPKSELAVAGTKTPPKEAQIAFLAEVGRRFEDVILATDDREVIDGFAQRGYRPAAEAGRVHLLEFEGCPLEIEVVGAPVRPGALIAQAGLLSIQRPSEQHLVPADEPWPDGGRTVRWPRLPCGELWLTLQVGFDVPVSQMSTCREFQGRRRVSYLLTPDNGKLTCTLGPARR